MRTYYFSADTQEDMSTWLRAMNQATLMQNSSNTLIRTSDKLETFDMLQQQAVPQTNHVTLHQDPDRPVVHEVLLEPIHRASEERCSLHKYSPASTTLEHPIGSRPGDGHAYLPPLQPRTSTLPQLDTVPSRAPSRAASTLPSSVCTRNGLVSTPSPILEPNGIAAGTYQRAPADSHRLLHRRSTLEQVEQWVKVQKADHKGEHPPSSHSTDPAQVHHTRRVPDAAKDPRQSPTPARLGEYKYAQDRLSHFRLAPDPGPNMGSNPGPGTVWQLYEWQQRHQYRHGSPTAPLYTPAPDYPFGPRPPSTVPQAPRSEGPPRCVSVPPTAADIPPPGPPPGSSRTLSPTRRPHTPAGRVTVRPAGERSVLDGPFAASTIERRSMPPSGYITHTVSAPSLHGKTAKMAAARHHAVSQLQRINGPSEPLLHNHFLTASTTSTSPLLSSGPSPVSHLGHDLCPLGLFNTQSDDTYMQLKKDLEYLDLKVAGGQKEAGKPVKVAESDVDVKLSRLCEQDKILKDLEATISSLKEDKDKLESVLDVSHQQMELYHDQPAHAQKISYQQRLLQEDLVSIRAQISRLSTEMAQAWEEYNRLERSMEQLRTALQAHMNHSATPQQEKGEMKRELWRIEDVQPPTRSSVPNARSQTLPHSTVPKWAEDSAPPGLPSLTSMTARTRPRGAAAPQRGTDMRSYLSEPELPALSTGADMDYLYFQGKGLSGPSSHLNQSNYIASYVTLRRGPGGSAARERPKSALELLSSPPDVLQLSGAQPRGRMTAEEQLERMKRHQKALVRERKRNLSQERSSSTAQRSSSTAQRSSSSSRLPTNTSDPPASVRYPPRSSSRHRELHLHHHCCYTLQPPGT
ncbi:hypothetical protein F7725_023253 [Dissostichus mawsoni]|uniref:PH domain-containing protein n=1 Tax=Dissostichus mawsoni TaxID=36200 RepID=A0A7J5Z4F5_DISMA|nr:hypothetical protein F7725_023253 [Dissostichus mawsoni]